jgi:glycosyltransferase involved in cell wall biosynthesis
MQPKISVIIAASRGAKFIDTIINDFRNQIFQNFEIIIVYDGKPPKEVEGVIENIVDDRFHFFSVEKDPGNMKIAPGTRPRNAGLQKAKGNYVVFFDDDDRAKDSYLAGLMEGTEGNTIGLVQMTCSEKRMYTNGNPSRFVLVPEIGLPYFPIICHVGTPCFCVPRQWALDLPWREEPEHDFRFIKRICEKYKPAINFKAGMRVDVDGLIIKETRDWVSKPPFFRNENYWPFPRS